MWADSARPQDVSPRATITPTPAMAPMVRNGMDPRSSVSPDEECLYRLNGLASLNDVPQGGALVHLDDSGVGHSAAQGHEAGAGFLGYPAGAKRTGTIAGDERDVGQRLGVVYQGWALPDAERNAFVRTEDGSRAGGVDPVGQRRFFAGNETIRGKDDFLADSGVSVRPPLLHGVTHRGDRCGAAIGHADHNAITTAQGREILGTVEHQMRGTSQK
jgi:hypothetical protein